MIATIIAQFGPWIVGILGALGGIFAIFASAKAKGKAEGRAVAAETIAKEREQIAADSIKKADAANATQTKAVENANEAISNVNSLGDAAASDELRSKWTRD